MRKFYSVAIVLALVLAGFSLHAQNAGNKSLLDLVKKNAAQLNISPADADNLVISHAFTDDKTNIQYVYLQQMYQNIKVFNSIMTVIFRNNEVLYSSGRFVDKIQEKAGAGLVSPAVQAEQAINNAALHLKLPILLGLRNTENKFATEKKMTFSGAGIAKEKIETELFWVVADDGSWVKLAWNVNIDELRSADWWNVRIDATTGAFLEKNNLTVHEKREIESDAVGTDKNNVWTKVESDQPGVVTVAGDQNKTYTQYSPPSVTTAGYYVSKWPSESPRHNPMGTETSPWLRAGAGNAAITNGWHFDGTTNYNITRGNNVHAYLDIANNNNPSSPGNISATSTTPDPVLTFGTVPDFTLQPGDANNRLAAITNLFYWNNTVHDILYQYGFDEKSGNFQTDNLGRGGAGNDYVQAEAQDGGGTDNANFATPADGQRPRMQMYLWSGVPTFKVNTPAAVAGNYFATESGFSTANKLKNVGSKTGQVVYYNDDGTSSGTHYACNGTTPGSLTGKIAMIIRGGGCAGGFVEKVKNAQNNGAIAVIMVNNVAGFPITMGGTDNTITIPAVMISQADGALLAAQLANNLNVTLSAGVDLDGDLDNGVIAHEYGHGVSNRLTGGAPNSNCLGNAEQGGEGWSDYLALMQTTNWATATVADGPLARPMGVYAVGQPLNGTGIRTYPYSTDMTINPHTYTDVANPAQAGEVHYIGEVWCSALWDMTWFIIQQENSINTNLFDGTSTKGNSIALRLVMEGMRLQTCRPGFLDARNAILAADSILYGYRHRCAIWNAFARRGMGLSASQGSSASTTDGVAAFDVPSLVELVKTATPLKVIQGEKVEIKLNATCQCLVNTNYTLRDTIPAGFSYVSSTNGGTLSGNVVTWPALNFGSTQETKTYAVTIQPTIAGCAIVKNIDDNRDGSTTGGLTSVIATGNASTNWVTSTARAVSPTTSWFSPSNNVLRDVSLTSNAAGFTAGSLSVLSFNHFFITKNTIDGGRVEYSTDGGTTWNDAGPMILQNGYNNICSVANTWGVNQKMFGGVSYGRGNGQFITSIVNLSSLNGQNVRLRFRTKGNTTNQGTFEGWYIDDILQQDGCGGIVKAGLYNASAARVDSLANPVFVVSGTPIAITTQPVNTTVCNGSNATFTTAATPASLPTYQWQLSTDGGTTWNNVPAAAPYSGTTSASLTITGATLTMNGYQYRAIAYDNTTSGFVISNAATLNVNPIPTVNAVGNQSLCPGSSTTAVNFTGTVAGTVYNWTNSAPSIGLAASGTGNIPSFVAVNTGITAVVATITVTPTYTNNGVTCTGTPTSFTITVTPNPDLVIIADPGTTLCAGDPTKLTVVQSTPPTPVGTLYTQGGAVGASPVSQNFETANDAFDNQAAEDFTVPANTTWNITQVSTGGMYFNGAGPSTSYNVFIYRNSATNTPGTLVANYNNLTYTGGANPVMTIPSTSLTAGTYWLSVQSNMSFAVGGEWAWGANGTTATGLPWMWQNPNGGFASACNSWGNGAATCIVGTDRNLIFTLTGTSTTAGAQPVGSTYLWTPAAGLSSTTSNPVAASPATTTTYTVTATTAAGCTKQASITITVNQRPAVTTQPANTAVCAGQTATFTAAGTGTGAALQWQVSTDGGVTWTNLANGAPYSGVATGTLTINPVTQAMNGYRYRLSISGTCPPVAYSNGGILTVNPLPVVTITPSVTCGGIAGTNGTLLTASSPTGGNFIWTPATGLYTNATATTAYVAGTPTATVYAAPTVNTVYTVSATNGTTGCVGTGTVTVNYTPVAPTVTPASATICLGQVQALTITSSLAPVTVTAASGPVSVAVPDGTGDPALSNVVIAGIPAAAVISEVKVTFTMTHTWVGDMDINIKAPNNAILNLVGGLDGGTGSNGTANFTGTSVSSIGTVAMSGAPAPRSGTYKADALAGYGPTGYEQTTASWANLIPTATAANGTWTLAMGDWGAGDNGTLTSWSVNITYGLPSGGIWSPNTGLYLDAGATVPYTGTVATTVYASPAISTTYSVTVNTGTCTSPARLVPITVNTPIAITTQPTDKAVCTNNSTSFTTVATGSAITHNWQVSTANGTPGSWVNIANGGVYSGANTGTLTIAAPPVSMNGYFYRDSISTSPCAGKISNVVRLTVNPLPTIGLTAVPYTKLMPGMTTTLTTTVTPPAATFVWYRDGAIVAGANAGTLPIGIDGLGKYYVSVTDVNGCTNTSNSVLISDSASGKVFIYPNPNSGIFQVRYYSTLYSTGLPRGINIYDAKGARVITQKYTINAPYARMDVDMRKYGSGTYWVEVVDLNGNRLAMGRVMIVR